MWIGRATAYASHCPVDALTAGSHTKNHGFIRYSEGKELSKARACKRKALSPEQEQAPSSLRAASSAGAAASQARPRQMERGVCGSGFSSRAKKAKLAQLSEAACSEAQLQRWLHSRPAAKSAACVSASERMAALRQRVAERCQK